MLFALGLGGGRGAPGSVTNGELMSDDISRNLMSYWASKIVAMKPW